jgi:hypothetical protein
LIRSKKKGVKIPETGGSYIITATPGLVLASLELCNLLSLVLNLCNIKYNTEKVLYSMLKCSFNCILYGWEKTKIISVFRPYIAALSKVSVLEETTTSLQYITFPSHKRFGSYFNVVNVFCMSWFLNASQKRCTVTLFRFFVAAYPCIPLFPHISFSYHSMCS